MLKGYWQVPLTERMAKISAFVTLDDFLNYKVMAFGLRNAPGCVKCWAVFKTVKLTSMILLFTRKHGMST